MRRWEFLPPPAVLLMLFPATLAFVASPSPPEPRLGEDVPAAILSDVQATPGAGGAEIGTVERLARAGDLPEAEAGLFAERPLFEAGRRQPQHQLPHAVVVAAPVAADIPSAAAPEPVAETPPPEILYRGYMAEGLGVQALLAHAASPEGEWLGPHAEVRGWSLLEIAPDHVRLGKDGAEITIQMFQ